MSTLNTRVAGRRWKRAALRSEGDIPLRAEGILLLESDDMFLDIEQISIGDGCSLSTPPRMLDDDSQGCQIYWTALGMSNRGEPLCR